MFSIVIPTLWLVPSIVQTVEELEKNSLVKEIIIVNNNPGNELLSPVDFSKVQFINPGENIFISASWNQGVAHSSGDIICLLNDDVIPNQEIFESVQNKMSETVGIIGGHLDCWNNTQHQDIFEEITSMDSNPGFGSMMFIRKDKYKPIPEKLKIWYNDNWLFENIDGSKFQFKGACLKGSTSQTINHPQMAAELAEIIQKDTENWQELKRKLRICVYAISKNEEQFVQRFYDSSKEADLILIADTGSTDKTTSIARSLGITVYDISVQPWRFDDARNIALGLVPQDYDILISLDLDEELQPGWRQEVERLWTNGVNRIRYMYDWGQGIQFHYEKIHSRKGFRWANICHEVIVADPRTQEKWAQTNKLLVVHKPDPAKSRGQYLTMLEADVKENPHNARNAFYYARELYFYQFWDKAIIECKRYLDLPNATWNVERCYAYRVIGKCYQELGKYQQAHQAFRKAINEASNAREPWVDLADFCYHTAQWNECYFAATQALSITHRERNYTDDPKCWSSHVPDIAALAAWNLGNKEQAIKFGKLARDMDPTNVRLCQNYGFYAGLISQE